MQWKWILPTVYIMLSAVLLFVFGGAGHGWGIEAWFWISLPASLISLLIETPPPMLVGLVAAIFQYWALGFVLDRLTKK